MPARIGRGQAGPGTARAAVLASACLLTATGGALDAWTYLEHGHVFANAQTGNVVLLALAAVGGDGRQALGRLASLAAFVAGLFASTFAGNALKRRGANSRSWRLGAECVLLLCLAPAAARLPAPALTAGVGFIAALQITTLSHVGGWSFNTAMTTGNFRSATTAASKALAGQRAERPHAFAMAALCLAFPIGALAGAALAPALRSAMLLLLAGLVAAGAALSARVPDPMPDWRDL